MKELWEELINEYSKFRNPVTGSNDEIIIGSGNRTGSLLFIGDDFNLYKNEELMVAPSSSGEFLIKLCDLAEISPENYYITTLTKQTCRFKDYLGNEKEKLKELLFAQIALIEPEIIVALGPEVAKVLDSKIDFNKEKGKIKNWCGGIKLIATYDTYFAYKSRIDQGKTAKPATEFWNDIKLIGDTLKGTF